MKPALIDTNIISLFLRNDPNVVNRFATYLEAGERANLSIITVYEVISGLKHRDAKKQLSAFQAIVAASDVWSLTDRSVEISTDAYAALRKRGRPIDDLDLLIAGIALANDFVMVTNNRKHFEHIEGLRIEDWGQKPAQG